jgi:hypothetical protein
LNANSSLAVDSGLAAKADDTPIVYVVDDDISVRESLELLIRFADWKPELFRVRP